MNRFEMNIEKNIYRLFESDLVEKFFFSLLLATVFVAGLGNPLLELSYKYVPAQAGKDFYVDYNWVFWGCAVISVFYLIRNRIIYKRKIEFDFALIFLIQTLIIVGVLEYHNESYGNIPYAWILPMAYILGKLAVGRDKAKVNQRIMILVYSLMLALFVVTMLDFYVQLVYYPGFTEWWAGFWIGEEQNRCTMAVGLFLVQTSLVFVLFRRKENPFIAVLVVIGNCVAQYWAWVVQSRTITIMPLLVLVVFFGIYIYDKNIVSRRICLIGIVIIGVFVMMTMLIFTNNWFNLADIYHNSVRGEELVQNERFEMNINGFRLMIDNPLGRTIFPDDEFYRPHDTYLRYGESFGIAVFCGMELHRLITFKDAFKMILCKSNLSWIK